MRCRACASTLVTNGDTFVEVGWEALLRAHRDAQAELTVVLKG
jgi:ADP-glucose pyrophosphorylase